MIEDVRRRFKEEDAILYAVWGVTQKADLICSYMEEHYKNSKLVAA